MRSSPWPTFGGIFGVLLGSAPALLLPDFSKETGNTAADHALALLLALALPALALAIFREAQAPRKRNGTESESLLRRYGFDERPRFVRLVLWRSLGFVLVGTLFAALALANARSLSDPLLVKDLRDTLPVFALGSLAFATTSAVAHLWLGRVGLLLWIAVNFVLGHLDLSVALATPLGNLRHLTALGESLSYAPEYSSLALGLFALVSGGLVFRSSPR